MFCIPNTVCTFFGLELLEFVWILISPLCPIRFECSHDNNSHYVWNVVEIQTKNHRFFITFWMLFVWEIEIENSPDSIHIQIHTDHTLEIHIRFQVLKASITFQQLQTIYWNSSSRRYFVTSLKKYHHEDEKCNYFSRFHNVTYGGIRRLKICNC